MGFVVVRGDGIFAKYIKPDRLAQAIAAAQHASPDSALAATWYAFYQDVKAAGATAETLRTATQFTEGETPDKQVWVVQPCVPK